MYGMMLYRIKKRMGPFLQKEKGFTLVELTVVMVCVSFITLAIPLVVQTTVDSFSKIRSGKHYSQSARIGFRQIIAEFRQIERSSQIDFGDDDEIQIDLPTENNIHYEYSSTYKELYREGDRLVFPVSNFEISYYDDNGNEISSFSSSRNDIWLIEVRMVVGDEDTEIIMWDQIQPRGFN